MVPLGTELHILYTTHVSCDTTEHEYRSHYTVVCQWHTGNIVTNTIQNRHAMPHNSISPALFVSTAVGLGFVADMTRQDYQLTIDHSMGHQDTPQVHHTHTRTILKSLHLKLHPINIMMVASKVSLNNKLCILALYTCIYNVTMREYDPVHYPLLCCFPPHLTPHITRNLTHLYRSLLHLYCGHSNALQDHDGHTE